MTRPVLFVSTAASIATTAVVTSWVTATILLTAILIVTTALCWILADHDRPRRLALLLTAWRHGIPPTLDQPTTLPTKPQIVINYREGDSEQTSSTLHSELCRALGHGNVFFPSTSTQPGTNHHRAIENQLRRADAMLVFIGPQWMDIHDEHDTRLLDHDNDHVRSEIEQALALNLRVIPILLDNATLDTARLPHKIAHLGTRPQLHYRPDHHDHDFRTIIEDVAFASHAKRTDPG
jgi:TIR domain-containing protein